MQRIFKGGNLEVRALRRTRELSEVCLPLFFLVLFPFYAAHSIIKPSLSTVMVENQSIILISGMFSVFFEVVIHDIPYKDAKEYLTELSEFYIAGWKKLWGYSNYRRFVQSRKLAVGWKV